MSTKYQKSTAQRTLTKGKKTDYYQRQTRAERAADIDLMLTQAKERLEKRILEKDEKAVAKLKESIACLEETKKRMQQASK